MRHIHISWNYLTSLGHRSIHRCLERVIAIADPTNPLILSLSFNDTVHDSTEETIAYVDFPDANIWEELKALKQRRAKTYRFVYLAMTPNLTYMNSVNWPGTPFEYDLIVALEPAAVGIRRTDTGQNGYDMRTELTPLRPHVKIEPLVDQARFTEEQRAHDMTSDTLVVVAGFARERDLLTRYARSRGYEATSLLPSIGRAITWVAHPMIRTVYSPAGYSNFWEIFLLGCSQKVKWMRTDRPIEGILTRIALLTPDRKQILDATLANKQRLAQGNDPVSGRAIIVPTGINHLARIIQEKML